MIYLTMLGLKIAGVLFFASGWVLCERPRTALALLFAGMALSIPCTNYIVSAAA